MGNKCEWKDGTHIMCDKLSWYVKRDISRAEEIIYFDLCPFCGADIRKPEPKYCNSECGMRMNIQAGSCKKYDCKYIKTGIEPEKPLVVKSVEERLYVVAISGDKQETTTKLHRTILSFAVKAYSAKEALGIAIGIFRDKKDGYSVEVWEGHEITEENILYIGRDLLTPHELQEAE